MCVYNINVILCKWKFIDLSKAATLIRAVFLSYLQDIEVTMPRKIPQKVIDQAIAKLDEVREDWMKRQGVTAVDVGYKFINGKMTDQVAIRVHVKRKLPVEVLGPGEIFPEKLGNFPVDIIEAEYGLESLD
jgi:hypothetical protein